jgi:hypothetical protein
MQYTINGKDYTEFDIKLCCSELMDITIYTVGESKVLYRSSPRQKYDPCTNWNDAGPIIEKRWDELNKHCYADNRTRWQLTMEKHNCTKLIAACIFFIEMNEDK